MPTTSHMTHHINSWFAIYRGHPAQSHQWCVDDRLRSSQIAVLCCDSDPKHARSHVLPPASQKTVNFTKHTQHRFYYIVDNEIKVILIWPLSRIKSPAFMNGWATLANDTKSHANDLWKTYAHWLISWKFQTPKINIRSELTNINILSEP